MPKGVYVRTKECRRNLSIALTAACKRKEVIEKRAIGLHAYWNNPITRAKHIQAIQTARQNRIEPRGSKHWNWKGEKITKLSGYNRYKKDSGPCERCGANKKIERHHKDGDPRNNNKSNIKILCHRCHMIVDGRMFYLPRYKRTEKHCKESSRRMLRWHQNMRSSGTPYQHLKKKIVTR